MQIVWVHGFPLSPRVFDRQRPVAARHVMPDLRDCDATTIDDYARFVLDRVKERSIFAGLSMGGYVCFAIARIAPEKVAGLLLIDTRETPDTPEGRKGRYDTIEKVKTGGVNVVVESMLPKMLTPSASPEKVAEVRAIMESSPAEYVTTALHAMAERRDSSDLLPKLNVPALVIAGDQDTITPPSDAERMARALPDAKLVVIPGAAHLSNVEKDAEFNRSVNDWLSGSRR